MKKQTLIIKPDVKRKMTPEELQHYLRESKRGCGVHNKKSHKKDRKKTKEKLRRWK